MPGIITVRLRKRREDVGREADAHIIALNTIHRPSGGGVYSECIVQQRQLHKSRGLSLPLCVCVCLHTCVVQCGGRMGRDAFCFITACQGGKKVPLVCGGPGREEWKPKKRKSVLTLLIPSISASLVHTVSPSDLFFPGVFLNVHTHRDTPSSLFYELLASGIGNKWLATKWFILFFERATWLWERVCVYTGVCISVHRSICCISWLCFPRIYQSQNPPIGLVYFPISAFRAKRKNKSNPVFGVNIRLKYTRSWKNYYNPKMG